jgi:hypothetical protein
MKNRQQMRAPMMPTVGPSPLIAWPKVPTMMMISSKPSMNVYENHERKPTIEKHTHALTSNDVGEPTKEKLTKEGTDRGCNLDAKILVCVQGM